MRIEIVNDLAPELITMFRDLYRDSFAGMDERAAARQSLTDDEFVEEMGHPSVVKWLCWTSDDNPAALAFMTTDLTHLPWVSAAYYDARFPDHAARRAIHYFGGLVVHPDHRGGHAYRAVLLSLLEHAAERDAIIAFDCCAFNVDQVRLPQTLAKLASRVGTLNAHEIDVQRYYAYEMSLKAAS